MIYETCPINFNPVVDVVACFVQYGEEILLLKRHPDKPKGNTWGLPAGKIDNGENKFDAIQRETKEETGLMIPNEKFVYAGQFFVKQEKDFIYSSFKTTLDKKLPKPVIKLSLLEHTAMQWTTPKQALELELVGDLDSCIKLFYEI